jgi:hypothetical protein
MIVGRPGNSGGSWESHSKRQIGQAETLWLILRYFAVNPYISHKYLYLTMTLLSYEFQFLMIEGFM